MSAIRYLVVGLGCNLVFLDHLTAITDQYDREVNQRTRNLIVKLGQLVAALPFSLFAISHIRKADGKPAEEGGRVHLDDMLGASALKQWHTMCLPLNATIRRRMRPSVTLPIYVTLRTDHEVSSRGLFIR